MNCKVTKLFFIEFQVSSVPTPVPSQGSVCFRPPESPVFFSLTAYPASAAGTLPPVNIPLLLCPSPNLSPLSPVTGLLLKNSSHALCFVFIAFEQ